MPVYKTVSWENWPLENYFQQNGPLGKLPIGKLPLFKLAPSAPQIITPFLSKHFYKYTHQRTNQIADTHAKSGKFIIKILAHMLHRYVKNQKSSWVNFCKTSIHQNDLAWYIIHLDVFLSNWWVTGNFFRKILFSYFEPDKNYRCFI